MSSSLPSAGPMQSDAEVDADSSDSDMDEPSEIPPSRSPLRSDSGDQQSGLSSSQTASQKRRRVTRACDECRRKKIKCDGKGPCAHCSIYGYECTYDQPSNRRRNAAPQYVEGLEQKLRRAQAVIRAFLPNVNLDDPSLDSVLEAQEGLPPAIPPQYEARPPLTTAASNDSKLESMVGATGQLDLDGEGNWDYHGHSSGLSFIRQVRDQLGDLAGPEQAEDDEKLSRPTQNPSGALHSLSPDSLSPMLGSHKMESPFFANADPGKGELPSRELALSLCSASLDDAAGIVNIVHQPTFYRRFDRIYDLPADHFDNEDQKFLPLLYIILGLGCLYAKDEHSELKRSGYKTATSIGYKYFWASRQLLDITDCRDMTTLQAICFMIFFLQSSAKLATCYAYIGVALRSAMRMGLHRSFRDSFDPLEAELRKRMFWSIRKMDIYVGAMLGLPLTLAAEDIDQEFPAEVTDECITAHGIDKTLQRGIAPMACANAEFRLLSVFSKIMKIIYPIKGFRKPEQGSPSSYSVSYTAIREVELDLKNWEMELPDQLKPNSQDPEPVQRMQQLLRLFYAHAQLMLYRPFLHYVSSKNQAKTVNQRSHACATACVSVSRNIIHITSQMKKDGLLQGSHWFSMYVTFFGILSLVFFALENPESASNQEVLKDATDGRHTLAALAQRSMAADRCTSTLTTLFEHLGPTLETARKSAKKAAPRKREAEVKQSNISATHSQPTSNSQPLNGGRGQNRKRGAQKPSTDALQHAATYPQPSVGQSSKSKRRPPIQTANFVPQHPGSDSPITASAPSAYETPHIRSAPPTYERSRSQAQTQLPLLHSQGMGFLHPQFQNTQYSTSLNDMSAVMFPTDNPFAYPNPPMTTLEQNYAFDQQSNDPYHQTAQHLGSSNMRLPASAGAAGTVSADEHVDAQLFGPLPPYMSQGQNPGFQGVSPWDQRAANQFAAARAMPTSGAEMYNQQARSHGLPGLNLDGVFGEEEWRREN